MKRKQLPTLENPAATTPSTKTVRALSAPRDEVPVRAYFMYLNQGSRGGLDVEHWLQAEAEVEAYHAHR